MYNIIINTRLVVIEYQHANQSANQRRQKWGPKCIQNWYLKRGAGHLNDQMAGPCHPKTNQQETATGNSVTFADGCQPREDPCLHPTAPFAMFPSDSRMNALAAQQHAFGRTVLLVGS